MNLQFFAEDGADDTSGADNAGDEQGNEGGTGDQNQGKSGEKTFTQAEVNAMMKAEKSSGRQSILKELGIEAKDTKDAKAQVAAYLQFVESQKTEAQKSKEKLEALTSEKSAAEQKALLLESKFTAIAEGVKLEDVDDVLTLAMSKVTDDKDLKTVLGEMKEKYPSFFSGKEDQGGKGTGTGTGVGSGSGKSSAQGSTGIGSRLAASRTQSSTNQTKSSYFSR